MSIRGWHVVLMDDIHKAHGWHVDEKKVYKAMQKGANGTYMLPIERQRFTGEGGRLLGIHI